MLTNAQCHVDNVAAEIYDAETGARLRRLPGIGVDHVTYSPDGKRILGYRVHFLKNQISVDVWDAETTRHLELKGHAGLITFAEFSPDSQSIVTGSTDGTARLWDADSGKLRLVLRGHHNTIRTARFSPDGKWIATASADETARIWSATTGQEWMTLSAGRFGTANVEFAPDSRRILTVSQNLARIWPVDPLPLAKSLLPRQLTTDEKSRFQIE